MKVVSVLSLALLVVLPSCGLLKKKPRLVEVNRNIRLAGRVQQVDKVAKFVLIRRYGPWRVGEGEVVESRGDGRTASLQPTGERLGEYVAADIRSGGVESGDGVYIRKVRIPSNDGSSGKPDDPAKPDRQPETPQTR